MLCYLVLICIDIVPTIHSRGVRIVEFKLELCLKANKHWYSNGNTFKRAKNSGVLVGLIL